MSFEGPFRRQSALDQFRANNDKEGDGETDDFALLLDPITLWSMVLHRYLAVTNLFSPTWKTLFYSSSDDVPDARPCDSPARSTHAPVDDDSVPVGATTTAMGCTCSRPLGQQPTDCNVQCF
jgi:hypothetical protein